MLHKLSMKKWREVYKMHKTGRAEGSRAAEELEKGGDYSPPLMIFSA
jgi:hypothetical protein